MYEFSWGTIDLSLKKNFRKIFETKKNILQYATRADRCVTATDIATAAIQHKKKENRNRTIFEQVRAV